MNNKTPKVISKTKNILILIITALMLFTINQACTPNIDTSASNEIEIIKTSSKNDDLSQHVYVTVKNKSNKLCKSLMLESIYTDAAGKTVGTGNGAALNIAGGATKVVDCMAMGVEGATKYNVQIGLALFE